MKRSSMRAWTSATCCSRASLTDDSVAALGSANVFWRRTRNACCSLSTSLAVIAVFHSSWELEVQSLPGGADIRIVVDGRSAHHIADKWARQVVEIDAR